MNYKIIMYCGEGLNISYYVKTGAINMQIAEGIVGEVTTINNKQIQFEVLQETQNKRGCVENFILERNCPLKKRKELFTKQAFSAQLKRQ